MQIRSILIRATLAAAACGITTMANAWVLGEGDAMTGKPHPAGHSTQPFQQARDASMQSEHPRASASKTAGPGAQRFGQGDAPVTVAGRY